MLKENYQNMVKDTYMVQTRSQGKAQAKAPTIQSTKPVTQNTIPKVDKIPVKTEKEKDSKSLPSVVNQQLPQGLIIPPGTIMPSIGMHPSVTLPPKPPNAEDTSVTGRHKQNP